MSDGVVTSPRNPRVAAARLLRRRSGREAQGSFLIEGVRAVTEVMQAKAPVERVFMSEDAKTSRITALARERGVELILAGPRVIASLSDSATPQGVVAVARSPLETLDALGPGTLVLVLAEVRDPGNAGTLVRSAAAAGASAVIFTRGGVDPLNPKTVRAAAGALFSIRLVATPSLEDALGRLRGEGVEILGAAADAPVAATQRDLTRPLALVLGNEAWGLSPGQRRLLDAVVGIPMPGPVESLNVAIAGSILLFEVVRQRTARDQGHAGLSSAPKIQAPTPDRG